MQRAEKKSDECKEQWQVGRAVQHSNAKSNSSGCLLKNCGRSQDKTKKGEDDLKKLSTLQKMNESKRQRTSRIQQNMLERGYSAGYVDECGASTSLENARSSFVGK